MPDEYVHGVGMIGPEYDHWTLCGQSWSKLRTFKIRESQLPHIDPDIGLPAVQEAITCPTCRERFLAWHTQAQLTGESFSATAFRNVRDANRKG